MTCTENSSGSGWAGWGGAQVAAIRPLSPEAFGLASGSTPAALCGFRCEYGARYHPRPAERMLRAWVQLLGPSWGWGALMASAGRMDAGAQRMSEPAKTVGRRWLWTLALLLLLGGGGYYGRRWYAGHQGSDQSQTAQQKSPAPAACSGREGRSRGRADLSGR